MNESEIANKKTVQPLVIVGLLVGAIVIGLLFKASIESAQEEKNERLKSPESSLAR